MLSEKKVSKKSPSKTKISSVLEQIGLLSRGKSEHMLTPEGGGIAERPLTATNTYNIRRSRTSLMFRLLPTTASCGGLGAKPPEVRVQGRLLLLGVGKAHGFSGLPPALVKRKLHLQASLPLNPLCGNIAVKVGSYFLRKSPPYP